MAPALTSNPCRVSTGLYSKPNTKSSRPTITVCARTRPSESESQDEGSSKANRFFIDFGKIPDAKSLIPVVTTTSGSFFASPRRKDPNTVFVAGATGQSGVRIAQMLLRQGFAVRAGVPDLGSAQEIAQLAASYKIISPAEAKRLNAVESTFNDPELIAKAIGPAAKVVVTIGPGENGPTAVVTTDDALQVVRAAKLAGVGHVAVVYDSSGSTVSSKNNVLDGLTSFFTNISSIFAKSQALSIGEFLSKVVETEVSYTLIKAALTDDYSAESSHGIVVSKEGTISESKVAKSQIAKLVADVFSAVEIAENKVVEVSTSPSVTSKTVVELFSAIPEDGRRKAYAEALAKAKAEEEDLAASERARDAAEASKKLEEKKAQVASFADEAKAKAAEAGSTLDNLFSKAKDFGANGGFSWEKLSSQISTAGPRKSDDGPKTQVATVRGQARARTLQPRKAIVKQESTKAKPQKPEAKPDVRTVFGGLFKQETIYVDDE